MSDQARQSRHPSKQVYKDTLPYTLPAYILCENEVIFESELIVTRNKTLSFNQTL